MLCVCGVCCVVCVARRGGGAIYIVCDNIVIVVLTICNLTLSSILQKPN